MTDCYRLASQPALINPPAPRHHTVYLSCIKSMKVGTHKGTSLCD